MPKILIGTLSAARFSDRRAACLESWANPKEGNRVDVVFAVGGFRGEAAVRHGNILQCPCPDDFPSLPQKTRWLCRWALEHVDFDWLFKCDDDTYVRIDRLTRTKWRGDYIGHKLDNYAREGFASGGAGYLLSRKSAEIIARAMLATIGPEDVLVQQSLCKAGIELTHEPRFHPFETDWPRPDNSLITGHHCGPEAMRRIGRTFQ